MSTTLTRVHTHTHTTVTHTCTRTQHVLVNEAVVEATKKLVGGVVGADHPLAHGQGFGCGGGHDIRQARVHEHLHARVYLVFRTMAKE